MDKLYCNLDELDKLDRKYDELDKLRMSSMSWLALAVCSINLLIRAVSMVIEMN